MSLTIFAKKFHQSSFWLDSKYSYWQYCQKSSHLKGISPVLSKTFCVFYSNHAEFILPQMSEKRVTERKDWTLKAYLLLRKPVLDSRWLNHWK